ncbi:alpha/beta hydrolase [Companilactobacillus sp.]|uniref:alpha/beta hydrolase n=1 Tax=Companilactobacillus sp. TaxID=2767905 RepID=UPI0025C005D6|nr:alpha/beta fold hydrolase [Companilactobacillus sp.]MCH4009669.1 lysophospholipase [Companilactobacillus sp.]MCH4052655.1 lysophospholipase [Companilactobacillus sp.]MCH4077611.1 lysophospholipase [Companilactobacillus sp.]MCH4126187.1 lysophospholipase [Companilactobacillus sp.]MCI1311895.1 alpha/beta hydrolase [Companilactobacillus sp.]
MKVEITRDGLTLRGIFNKPDTDKFDLVILMHGFMGNKGDFPSTLLYQLAESFEDKGMATLRCDFDGHGQSDGRFQDMTVMSELADAQAIYEYAQKVEGVQNIYLVGHSQGGVVASMFAGYYPDKVAKLILLSPAATLKSDAEKGEVLGVKYDPVNVPDELHDFGSKVVGGFYLRTNKSLPIYEVSKLYQGPVCLIHGTDDKIVDPSASEKYDEIYQNSTLHLLPQGDHVYTVGNSQQRAVKIATDFLLKN